MRGEDGVKRMDLMKYCSKVVHETMRGTTSKFWYGNKAGGVKFGSSHLLPPTMDDGMFLLNGSASIAQLACRAGLLTFSQDNCVVKGTGLDILAKQEK